MKQPEHPSRRVRSGAPTRLAAADASRLPWRERLRAEGLELTNHYTHSSPCSPSRASLFTGQYISQHGVVDNVIMPEHNELDPAIPTIGSILRDAGYRSSYIGKWHCSQAPSPDMTEYGFADWEGNDRHFMGWAGTGVHFDPIIASNAASWLRANATTLDRAVVPDGRAREPARRDVVPDRPAVVRTGAPRRRRAHAAASSSTRTGRTTTSCRCSPTTTTRCATSCRRTSVTTCSTSPTPSGSGAGTSNTACGATSIPSDKKSWLRHLDYYVKLQQTGRRRRSAR